MKLIEGSVMVTLSVFAGASEVVKSLLLDVPSVAVGPL